MLISSLWCRSRRWLRGATVLMGLVLMSGLMTKAAWPFLERTIDPEKFASGPIKMLIYDRGHPDKKQSFAADSPEVKLVTQWLTAHPRGWTVNFNTYAPARYLTGERFTLNFHDRRVILNYQVGATPHRWEQVSRSIEAGDVPDVFGPPNKKPTG